jgi:acylphosphatase
VFFRASTRARALSLGVTGYARNLHDGRVEVLACGPDHAVGILCDWLRNGPPGARVGEVRCEACAEATPMTFQIV